MQLVLNKATGNKTLRGGGALAPFHGCLPPSAVCHALSSLLSHNELTLSSCSFPFLSQELYFLVLSLSPEGVEEGESTIDRLQAEKFGANS